MMVVAAVLAVISAALFTFFSLRSLLNHEWKTFLPLRLVVSLTMLAAATTEFVFLLLQKALPVFVFMSLAVLIGWVGTRAIIERYGSKQEPPVATQSVQELAGLGLATVLAYMCAVIVLFYS